MDKTTFFFFLNAMAFVWGAVWGPFLNVVIYRLPEGLSLVRPPSRCPKCLTSLAWYDNIPIFGWLVLAGRCRYCKVPIPIRYPAIELLTAVISLLLWLHVSSGRLESLDQDVLLMVGMTFFLYLLFAAVLVCITFIDLDRTIIPHELTAPATALGLLAAWLIPRDAALAGLWPAVGLQDSIIGLLVGGGLIVTIIVSYKLIRGIDGMGGGDATLMAMCGAWVGWRGVVFVLFAASVQGLVLTLLYTIVQKVRGQELTGDGHLLIDDVDAIDTDRGPSPAKPEPDPATEPEDLAPQGSEPDAVNPVHSDEAPEQGADPSPDTQAQAPAPEADAQGLTDGTSPDEEAATAQDSTEEVPFEQLAVPFGPFIVLATLEYILFGEWLLPWLLGI